MGVMSIEFMNRMIENMSEERRRFRSEYHLTLGKLIEKLEAIELKDMDVQFSNTFSPGREHSYRGYYEDLAFEPTQDQITVSELLEQCKRTLNGTYEGYKGGDFVMTKDTPLWCSDYGCHSGDAIIDTNVQDNVFVLLLKNVDEPC